MPLHDNRHKSDRFGARRRGAGAGQPAAADGTNPPQKTHAKICIIAAEGLLEFKRKFEK
jgi:hypothetical protein